MEDQSTFQQTKFFNISKVSLGYYHTLFQKDNEIYSCGSNILGELGLGHFKHQSTPSPIPNLPSNIVNFVCGFHDSLFLDSEGNVYSVGNNYHGQLGLGNNSNQNILNQITSIPPIRTISCVASGNYLLDFEGNIWSFGFNYHRQLGQGDSNNRYVPTKIESPNDIQQISHGACGAHFLAKDSQNTIYATGSNIFGQLGTGDTKSHSILKEINSKSFSIWGDVLPSKCKSARK